MHLWRISKKWTERTFGLFNRGAGFCPTTACSWLTNIHKTNLQLLIFNGKSRSWLCKVSKMFALRKVLPPNKAFWVIKCYLVKYHLDSHFPEVIVTKSFMWPWLVITIKPSTFADQMVDHLLWTASCWWCSPWFGDPNSADVTAIAGPLIHQERPASTSYCIWWWSPLAIPNQYQPILVTTKY